MKVCCVLNMFLFVCVCVCQNHYMEGFLPHIVCPLWALNWNYPNIAFDLICPGLTEKLLTRDVKFQYKPPFFC